MALKEDRLIEDSIALKSFRRRKLDELKAELALISQRCDEIEKRSRAPSASLVPSPEYASNENAEIRFATYIASGMSKVKHSGRPD